MLYDGYSVLEIRNSVSLSQNYISYFPAQAQQQRRLGLSVPARPHRVRGQHGPRMRHQARRQSGDARRICQMHDRGQLQPHAGTLNINVFLFRTQSTIIVLSRPARSAPTVWASTGPRSSAACPAARARTWCPPSATTPTPSDQGYHSSPQYR